MAISPIVTDALKGVLPHVLGVHDLDTPYPAKLKLSNGNLLHDNGVAMFTIDDGRLVAEFFGYDYKGTIMVPDGLSGGKLILTNCAVEIPIAYAYNNPKARSMYAIPMQALDTYNLIPTSDWISRQEVSSLASIKMILNNLPDLHLLESSTRSLTEFSIEKQRVDLQDDDWQVVLYQQPLQQNRETPVYEVLISKKEGHMPSPFGEGWEESEALRMLLCVRYFLSFLTGRWINQAVTMGYSSKYYGTVCARVGDMETPGKVDRFIATLEPPGVKWRGLFAEFSRIYADEKEGPHLRNAIEQFAECQMTLHAGRIHQAMTASQSTLEAILKWWWLKNEVKPFTKMLRNTVEQAELGKDSGRSIDWNAFDRMVKKATKLRKEIVHSDVVQQDSQSLVGLCSFYRELARLLIFAKLGDRSVNGIGMIIGVPWATAASPLQAGTN